MANKTLVKKILLTLIIALASFLRLYRIGDFLTFLGDEGRDVLVAKHILEGQLTLLGPRTSVGSMYLGPLYYYMIAPFLWLFDYNPVGPAIMVALFGIATVYLLYSFLSEFFSNRAGLMAAFLYSLSPLVLTYSRSSWNPNIMPFFSLLTIYSLIKAITGNNKWFILTGLSMGVVLQSHYLGLLLLPAVLVVAIIYRRLLSLKTFFLSLSGFLILISPFLLFNLRHNFVLIKAVIEFVADRSDAGVVKAINIFERPFILTSRLFNSLLLFDKFPFGNWLVIAIFLTLAKLFSTSHSQISQRKSLLVILNWFVVGILGLSIYQGLIFDYYLGFLFPLPFIMVALTIDRWWTNKYIGIISLVIIALFTFFSFKNSYFFRPALKLTKQTEEISRFVLDKTEGKRFNFALVAAMNSDFGYRYYFELLGQRAIPLEERVEEQLMIVCEDLSCQPLGHPLWEIAGFGRAEIVGEWEVSVVKVFRLVHHPDSIDTIGKPVQKGN